MASALAHVQPAAERCMLNARMSGIVLAVSAQGAAPQTLALGVDADDVPLSDNALFLVASVTKLATALVVLRLVDQRSLRLDDELARHLPDAASAVPGVTLRRMLSHSAGLAIDVAPERAPYQLGLTWATLAAACLAEPPRSAPGTVVQYGNTGYGLLAIIVERITGLPFATALRQLVLQPLAIEGYLGDEPPRSPASIDDIRGGDAPAVQSFTSPFYRSLAMPWSGLVTTAAGALQLVQAFAGYPANFLSTATRTDATSNQTEGLPGGSGRPLWYPDCPWGLGVELRGVKAPHWGPPNASPRSFGHAGASGCIAWHDPATNVGYAVVGTRTAANGWLIRHATQLGRDILATPWSTQQT